MIEKVFRGSRFTVLVAVLICAVSSLLLYGASINIIFNTALDFVRDVPASADGGKILAVRLLKLLDLLLRDHLSDYGGEPLPSVYPSNVY